MDISEFIEVAKNLNVLGIKITKDGELAAEWHSEPECRRNIYSATKSFTSCAVGFAVQEGLIDLNEKLTEAFSGDIPENIDDNLKSATVRDLLTMCLGQEKGNLMGEQRRYIRKMTGKRCLWLFLLISCVRQNRTRNRNERIDWENLK